MTDFLKMAAGLAVYNGGTYNGYRMGKARWELLGDIWATESRIKRERMHYAEVEVMGYDRERKVTGCLTVMLLETVCHPEKGKEKMEKKTGSNCYVLEESQVRSYLEQVQDTNPIHHGKDVVIPGLMLVDFILQLSELQGGKGKHTVRFREPLWTGIPFRLVTGEGGLRIQSPDETICYAEID